MKTEEPMENSVNNTSQPYGVERKSKKKFIQRLIFIILICFTGMTLLGIVMFKKYIRSRRWGEAAPIGPPITLPETLRDYNNNSSPHKYTGSLGLSDVPVIVPTLTSELKSDDQQTSTPSPRVPTHTATSESR